jgi:hypothetical protein
MPINPRPRTPFHPGTGEPVDDYAPFMFGVVIRWFPDFVLQHLRQRGLWPDLEQCIAAGAVGAQKQRIGKAETARLAKWITHVFMRESGYKILGVGRNRYLYQGEPLRIPERADRADYSGAEAAIDKLRSRELDPEEALTEAQRLADADEPEENPTARVGPRTGIIAVDPAQVGVLVDQIVAKVFQRHPHGLYAEGSFTAELKLNRQDGSPTGGIIVAVKALHPDHLSQTPIDAHAGPPSPTGCYVQILLDNTFEFGNVDIRRAIHEALTHELAHILEPRPPAPHNYQRLLAREGRTARAMAAYYNDPGEVAAWLAEAHAQLTAGPRLPARDPVLRRPESALAYLVRGYRHYSLKLTPENRRRFHKMYLNWYTAEYEAETIKEPIPNPTYFTPKEERMYRQVLRYYLGKRTPLKLAKQLAAMTINRYRREQKGR